MLDLGFLPDVERILRLLPDGRQTMLFSATMPGAGHLAGPPVHDAAHPHPRAPTPTTTAPDGRQRRAARLPGARDGQARDAGRASCRPRAAATTMVFCRTKRTAAEGRRRPAERGFAVRRRPRRPRPGRPRAGAARVPQRQGRRARRAPTSPRAASTSRASRTSSTTSAPRTRRPTCTASAVPAAPGAKGIAITFVDWDDIPRWTADQQGARTCDFDDPPETYSTSRAPLRGARHPRAASPASCRGPSAPGRASTPRSVEDLGETGQARSRKPASGGRSSSTGSSARSQLLLEPLRQLVGEPQQLGPQRSGGADRGAPAQGATHRRAPTPDAQWADRGRRRRRLHGRPRAWPTTTAHRPSCRQTAPVPAGDAGAAVAAAEAVAQRRPPPPADPASFGSPPRGAASIGSMQRRVVTPEGRVQQGRTGRLCLSCGSEHATPPGASPGHPGGNASGSARRPHVLGPRSGRG